VNPHALPPPPPPRRLRGPPAPDHTHLIADPPVHHECVHPGAQSISQSSSAAAIMIVITCCCCWCPICPPQQLWGPIQPDAAALRTGDYDSTNDDSTTVVADPSAVQFTIVQYSLQYSIVQLCTGAGNRVPSSPLANMGAGPARCGCPAQRKTLQCRHVAWITAHTVQCSTVQYITVIVELIEQQVLQTKWFNHTPPAGPETQRVVHLTPFHPQTQNTQSILRLALPPHTALRR
jgi:hypothetical protein